MAKLQEKKAAIEQQLLAWLLKQIDELESDQFVFDEEAFQEAMKAHKKETGEIK